MKKVIITGASSFIGRHLIKNLQKNNWKIYAVVRKGKEKLFQSEKSDFTILALDMKEYSTLSEQVGESCDVFISLAWNGTRGEERMDAVSQERNYRYSMDALYEAVKLGCRVVISAGSQAEYGPVPNGERISEKTACKPNTEYGKWKLKFYEDGGRFCAERNVLFIEPRFFSLYGEDDYENTMILSTLRRMRSNEPCELTECIQLWDFLYIEDAVEGIIQLINSEAPAGAYNFASGDTRVLKDFILEMCRITGTNSKLLFGAVPYPITGAVSIQPDITKLQKAIEWKVRTSFENGIRKIIEVMS